jgi:glycosyltransferase involved in cell wall biosynthesis
MKTLLLLDYLEDARMSMDIYGHGLALALRSNLSHKIQVDEFIPRKLAGANGRWGMRYARYFSYPRQLPQIKDGVCHIIDQGYGHLLHSLKDRKTVVTVHDLIPILRWKGRIPGVKPGFPPIFNLFSFHALRKADHLIAVSENTKKDLVRWIGCDPNRISVIHSGIATIFQAGSLSSKPLPDLFNLDPNKRKILISGSQFYKNNETALKIFSRLKMTFPEQIQLIKIGHSSPEWVELVNKYHLENDVQNLGPVSRELLPQLYQSVDLLLFPSLYEGFGWPPLEAMACGTPVVASSAASLPEVLGNAMPLYDPFDVKGFTDEITRILRNQDYRQLLIEKGFEQSSKYKWAETALKTIAVYEKVLA